MAGMAVPPESAMVGARGEEAWRGILAVVCAPNGLCGGNLQAGNRRSFFALRFLAPDAQPALAQHRRAGERARHERSNRNRLGQSAMHAVGQSAMRKALWRIVPLVALGYLCAYMDRVNVGFARCA
jgi:hypothetical protein